MNTEVKPQSVPKFSRRDNTILLEKFTALEQAELFGTLRQIQFNGQLVLTENKGQQWNFHFRQGNVLYVTGGLHSVRRWLRNLAIIFPDIDTDFSALQAELKTVHQHQDDYSLCWQYQLLASWVQQQKITQEQANKIVWLIFVEVLFDLAQADKVSYELKQEIILSNHHQLATVDIRQAMAEAQRQSKLWDIANIGGFSPNQVPIVKQVEQLRQNTSRTVYQSLTQLLDGQKTIRDLAVQMNVDVVVVTNSLSPFVQLGLVELINIPDAIAPVITGTYASKPQTPSIACLDDSPLICHIMQNLLSKAGYRCVGFNEPLKSIDMLLALKPDLIFLDLIMPNITGYEVCKRLRKYPHFKNTPIIILTASDGLVDRVKAKLVGASGFLSKTKVDQERVFQIIDKHLQHYAIKKIDYPKGKYQPNREVVLNSSQFSSGQLNDNNSFAAKSRTQIN